MGRMFSFLFVVLLVGGGAMLVAKNLPQASQTATPVVILEPIYEAPIAASTTVAASTTPMPEATAQRYTNAQISTHSKSSDCWTTIDGGVYDLTDWVTKHPGGQAAIMKICGKDGTSIFRNKHGTADKQQKALDGFKIGELAS